MQTCYQWILPDTHSDMSSNDGNCNFCDHFEDSKLSKGKIQGA